MRFEQEKVETFGLNKYPSHPHGHKKERLLGSCITSYKIDWGKMSVLKNLGSKNAGISINWLSSLLSKNNYWWRWEPLPSQVGRSHWLILFWNKPGVGSRSSQRKRKSFLGLGWWHAETGIARWKGIASSARLDSFGLVGLPCFKSYNTVRDYHRDQLG